MSGWDFESKTSTESSSENKKNFTKFPVGVTRIRVLDAEPFMRWIHWLPQFRRSITCPGNCPIDKIRKREKDAGIKSKYTMQRKFALNIFNHGTEQLEIMDEGIQFMEDLRDVLTDLKEEGHDLKDAVLKVRKRITDDKPSYRIDIDEMTPMNDEEIKAMDARTDFKEYFAAPTVEQIQALLEVQENTQEDYLKRFVEIITGEDEKPDASADEEIETE